MWVPLSEFPDTGCPQRHTVASDSATEKPCFLFGMEVRGRGPAGGEAQPWETTAH